MPIRRSSPPDEPFRVHPNTILKNLDATRRAQLGPLYGKFWVAPGVRWPSEFNEQGLWEPLPPKKPAESVRFAREEEKLKKASGAEFEFRAAAKHVAPTVYMAATASAYPNSAPSQSDKKRDYVSRSAVAELLDTADFSRDLEAIIVKREGREKGHRTYRRRHLVAALKGIWRASSSPYGTGEILCYASVEGYAIEAGVSERALRYNLRELERIGVIELVYAANTIRRPATYRLNLHKLRPRRTYEQLKQSRPPRRALHSVHHSSPRPSPPVQEAANTPVASRSVNAAPGAGSPVARRAPRRLTSREGPALVAKMVELMRGCEGHKQIDGYWVDYLRDPDNPDPRYRPPLSQEKAVIAACMTLGITEDDAREHLKLCCWKFEDAEPSP